MFLFDSRTMRLTIIRGDQQLQYKYIKWHLSLDTHTPTYAVLEKAEPYKLSLKTGKRSIVYEENVNRHGKESNSLKFPMNKIEEN